MLDFDLEEEVERRSVDPIWVAGIDEVGVGALAGPVTAAAVVLSKDHHEFYSELNDSKQVSRTKRERLYELITEHALGFGLGWATVNEIDTLGIVKCRHLILIRAFDELYNTTQLFHKEQYTDTKIAAVVDDHNMESSREFLGGEPSIFVDKADEKSLSVAAASIVAKVYRDNFMRWKGNIHSLWGFQSNVGYGTDEHMKALKLHGITELHRKSFKPIKALLKG